MKPRPRAALLALFFSSLLPVPSARASQYPLDQAAAIIPRDDAPRLRKAGIRTTEDFLVWGKPPKAAACSPSVPTSP